VVAFQSYTTSGSGGEGAFGGWMDDATPSYSPVSVPREGGLLAMRGRAVPVSLKRYGVGMAG